MDKGRALKLGLVLTLIFLSGAILGVFGLKALSQGQKEELASYLEVFLRGIGKEMLEPKTLFRLSIIQNLKVAFLIWLLGLGVIGAPIVGLIVAIRGFALGFSGGFLVKEVSGLSLFMRGVFPHTVVFIPGFLGIATLSVSFSLGLIGEKAWVRRTLWPKAFSYTVSFLILSLVLILSSVLEAYLSPLLLLRIESL